jgi:hypothetical protein
MIAPDKRAAAPPGRTAATSTDTPPPPSNRTPVRMVGDRRPVRRAGCPCGCATRLPWTDDPGCIRHKPLPPARDWPVYDAQTLGLVPHDRTRCASCTAAGVAS